MKRFPSSFLPLVLVFVPVLVSAQENGSVQVSGVRREYLVDVPAGYTGDVPYGLVMCFHGLGGTATGTRYYARFYEQGDVDSFITVYPQGLDIDNPLVSGTTATGWEFSLSGNRDVAFVDALIDSLQDDYNIHSDAVFATGISNGGYFSDILGCTLGDRLAAIAPVIGGYPFLVGCSVTKALPVLHLGTAEDEIVSIAHLDSATAFWVSHNGCDQTPLQDGMCEEYQGCEDASEVVHCEFTCVISQVQTACHTWPLPPTYGFSTTEIVLDFFGRHGLPPVSAGARETGRGTLQGEGFGIRVGEGAVELISDRRSGAGIVGAELHDARGRVVARAAAVPSSGRYRLGTVGCGHGVYRLVVKTSGGEVVRRAVIR